MSNSIEETSVEEELHHSWSLIVMTAFNRAMYSPPSDTDFRTVPFSSVTAGMVSNKVAVRIKAYEAYGVRLAMLAKTQSLQVAARQVRSEIYLAKREGRYKDVRILGTVFTSLQSQAYMRQSNGLVAENRRLGQKRVVGWHR